MPSRQFRANEISAGGVLARPAQDGYEVCLVNDGRYWGLPKGNVERGEKPVDAALREMSEETGVPRGDLRVVGALPGSEYVYRRAGRLIFKRVDHFLVMAPANAELHPDPVEISEAAWLTVDEAMARASFRDTRTALEGALRTLAGDGPAPARP
ncbi:MAG: NUDIX domain-containing protein [Candidatus Dormibacteraeota bacterium]|nr:NUDIX domain-containing protein [Candidatus Dormibacteraeota bacterium]MBV9525924.1 NUDIX domain-containing protein [Candidatus Dormibacteraeota bacterium]